MSPHQSRWVLAALAGALIVVCVLALVAIGSGRGWSGSYAFEWVAFLAVVAFGCYCLTLALGIAYPTLTLRQRCEVVFWLAAAAGAFRWAWVLS